MGTTERKLRDRERRIRDIQKAARDVFKRKWFQSATISEIAELAEVSTGTVFFYFKTKEQLYVSLILTTMEEFAKDLDKLYHGVSNGKYETCEDLMSAMMGTYVELHRKDPEGCYIIQNFHLNSLFSLLSKEVQSTLKEMGKHNFNTTRAIFDKAIELGLIQDVNTYMLADIVYSVYIGVAQVQKAKKLTSRKNILKPNLEYFSSLLCSGIKKSTEPKSQK
jgi:AcrR family transcriptional regulator